MSLDDRTDLNVEDAKTLDQPPSLDTFSSPDREGETLDFSFTLMQFEDGEFMTLEDNRYMRFE